MDLLIQDIRYAFRGFIKNPAFTIATVLTLALGIGANTLIFTVINAVLLHTLWVEKPSRLVTIYTTDEKMQDSLLNLLATSYPNYKDYRDRNHAMEGLAASATSAVSLSSGKPEEATGDLVSGNYFDVLGVKPFAGRFFRAEEDNVASAYPVVVLSYALWNSRFGGDPQIIGKSIELNGMGFTVIGIAPPEFTGIHILNPVALWTPIAMHDEVLPGIYREYFKLRRASQFSLVGRLRPGVTAEQSEADLRGIAAQLRQEYTVPNRGRSVKVIPLMEGSIYPNYRRLLLRAGSLLMVVVGFVLLVACANVANLLLARASGRRREIAVRIALGSGRFRLMRQLITESILLAFLGGIGGFFLALAVQSIRPGFLQVSTLEMGLDLQILRFLQQGSFHHMLDFQVLAYSFSITLVAGILFGLAPALQLSRIELVSSLKEKSGTDVDIRQKIKIRDILIVGEIAICAVALAGAGLFVRNLKAVESIDPGFATGHLLVISFNPEAQRYDKNRTEIYFRDLQRRVEALPGVRSATVASSTPLIGYDQSRTVYPEGGDSTQGGVLVSVNGLTTKYFETLGIPLREGRDFTENDKEGTLQVAVINETGARKFWPNQDALGKRFKFYGDDSYTQIVGIAKDAKYTTLGEDPQPFLYIPIAQNYVSGRMTLHVNTIPDPKGLVNIVKSEVQALDPNIPLTNIFTMPQIIAQALWAPKMIAGLLSVFALVVILLAIIGIYGVLTYSLNLRAREIGIRMALGGKPSQVLRLILKQSLVIAVVGLLVGGLVTFFLIRYVRSFVYNISLKDPAVFASVFFVVVFVVLLVTFFAARRAVKVDPMLALRSE
jgi:predicted permease